jgi:hypothetical protein
MKNLSVSMAIPVNLVASINALASAMGWGPNTFTVPLYSGALLTHYGCHTWADATFIDLVTNGRLGVLPTALAGQDVEVIAELLNALEYVTGTASGETWSTLLTQTGVDAQ